MLGKGSYEADYNIMDPVTGLKIGKRTISSGNPQFPQETYYGKSLEQLNRGRSLTAQRNEEYQSRTQALEQGILEKDLLRKQQMQGLYEKNWNPYQEATYFKKQKEYENAQIDFNMKQLQFRSQAMDWKKQMMQNFGFGRSTSLGGGTGYPQRTPSYGSPNYGPSPFPWKQTSSSQPSNMNQSWTSYSSPQFPTK